MTDDLVKRLLQIGEGAYVGAISDDRKVAREAANRIETLETALVRTFNNMMEDAKRIEQLEAALREIVTCPKTVKAKMVKIACKALEGK